MMHVRDVFLFVCLIVCGVYGKVTLKKGINETVVFHGDHLIIMVDNSLGTSEDLYLCFGSSTVKTYPPCPAGFARLNVAVYDKEKLQVTVNRQGQIMQNGNILRFFGIIKFNNDGALKIMVGALPDAKTIVTLPNAEIYVPEEPTEDETTKKNSHAATTNLLIIVVVLVIVAFIIVIIGVFAWCCLFRKAKRPQMTNLQEEVLPQQNLSRKPSKPKKPSSRNPSTSKTTTTTVSRLPVSPKQQTKPRVTVSMKQTQSSQTKKSKRVNRRKSSNNEEVSNSTKTR